jgi:hypothetical protein
MQKPLSLGRARAIQGTPKALKVVLHDEDNRTLWIPCSVIHDDSEVYESLDEGELRIIDRCWWARDNGYCD